MIFAKALFYFLSITWLTWQLTGCGELFPSEDDDDSPNKSLDERIPADWNGAEDWSGSDWEVTEE